MRKLQKGPELYAAIRQLHWEGRTSAEAAAILRMSTGRLNEHRRLLDLPPFNYPPKKKPTNAWTEAEDALLEQLIAAGVTLDEAASQFKRSRSAVRSRRNALELPYFKRPPRPNPRPAWPRERIEALADLHLKRRYPYRLCAEMLGTTRNAIAGAVRHKLKELA